MDHVPQEQHNNHHTFLQKFILFIRTQGVIGLAVAVVLGGAVQKVVAALVNDLINPLVGAFIGNATDLQHATITVGRATFAWGDFVSTLMDFLIIALIIYVFVKVVRADMLDKPKDAAM